MNLWQQFWDPVRVFLGLGASPGLEQILMRYGNLVHKNHAPEPYYRHDLQEDLQLALQTERFDSIRGAILERSGGISFIKTNE